MRRARLAGGAVAAAFLVAAAIVLLRPTGGTATRSAFATAAEQLCRDASLDIAKMERARWRSGYQQLRVPSGPALGIIGTLRAELKELAVDSEEAVLALELEEALLDVEASLTSLREAPGPDAWRLSRIDATSVEATKAAKALDLTWCTRIEIVTPPH